MTEAASIPGYRYGDPALAPSPVSLQDLEALKASMLFTEDDLAALKAAGEVLVPQTEQILDVWYGFVASQPQLVAYFSRAEGPSGEYLDRVRARFGQWIEDTCRADFGAGWLAYQEEIGKRHYRDKNATDGAAAEGTPSIINWRYVNALVYPIYATVRPFLEKGGADPESVERMHQAWLKAVLLQVTLWTRPYLREGAW